MDTITINFKASGQNLTADAHPQRYASNTVNYIQAVFELDDNWQSFDSVRAVWHNDFACISTVLDGNGACTVPHEVLANLDEVIVNLVGSDVDGEELVDRMTTYPLRVAIIDANARICGTETAEVTPSQFEQYVAIVSDLVHSVKDIDRIELNEDYTLTVYFSDETSWTSTSIRGEQGETGNGIASAVLNDDYTLTLTFTDGTSYTTSSIRGAQGPQGEPGEVTLAQLEQVLPTDTASGAIASFPDGSDLFDYLSCIVDIDPLQDLHGYDKPWVGGAGANKWDEVWENGCISSSGDNRDSANIIRSKNYVPVTPNTTYCIVVPSITDIVYFDENKVAIGNTDKNGIGDTDRTVNTRTTHDNCHYIRFWTRNQTTYNNDIAINYPSTVTTYSPYSNLCPITGWTGCEVSVAGVNFLSLTDKTFEQYEEYEVDEIPIGTYTYSAVVTSTDTDANKCSIIFLDKDKVTITSKALDRSVGGARISVNSVVFDRPCKYVRLYASNGWPSGAGDTANFFDNQLELGQTATAYEPYNGTTYPVSWQTEAGTVYGGTLDVVSGVLTVTMASVDLGSLTPYQKESGVYGLHISCPTSGAIICSAYPVGIGSGGSLNPSNIEDKTIITTNFVGTYYPLFVKDTDYTSAEDFKTAMNGVQLVYELATPQTYQLTPTQIHALLGQNNVWADCGDVEVQYKADVQRWVEKKLGE